ncbi:peptidylprolyl isomerase [Cohaesibacter celericrescens]|uniref:peptidylprolyl isomerase n=1 Tax=Cohaesibacter celericrescens TaxID=2067669 RepID=UPI0035698DB8
MMEIMRSMASGFVAKILMGLLVLSFAVWGIADIFTNFGQGAVATVGKTEIDARDYQSELILEVNALSNQLGQRLTTSQTAAFGLPNQVLGRMISEATLNDMATSFNLGLSPTVLAKEISTEPAFQSLGKFDRNQMNLVLRNAGTTEDRYVLTREALETRRQLAAALTGKSTIPTAALKAFNGFTFEKRDVNYIALKEEAIGDIEEPSDDALNKYFEEKKIAFRAPEYRSFEILKLEPGDIIDTESVTDEDAKIFYETAASRFVQPEKRQMQQILFNSEEEAKAAADKIAAGASYEDIMAERNLAEADVDFGLLTKEEITDPAAAEEIYSLEEGQISGVIKGRFGSLLLRTAKIVPSQASPFEELKEQLKAEIAAQRATGEVLDVFDKVEDERAGGSTLKEIANKLNLPLRTVNSISKVGELQNGDKVTDLPEQEQLLSSVFESDIDFEADPVEIDNSGFAWFIVTDIVNSRDRTIDEVKDDVIAAWKKDELTKRNAALSAEILKEVKGGKSLEAVATERGLTMETATDVTRQAGDALPASAVQQAFNGPLAYKASAVDGDTQYILEVAKVTEPEFDADALQLNALRQNLDTNVGTDMLSQLSSTVLSDIGYTINEALMQQIVNGTN